MLGALIVGVVVGAIPWIVRSIFDIFYVERRKRQSVAFGIAAELDSMRSVSESLKQREFFGLLAAGNIAEASKLRDVALVQAPMLNVDLLAKYRPELFLLKSEHIIVISEMYRRVALVRILIDMLQREKFDDSTLRKLGQAAQESFVYFDRHLKELIQDLRHQYQRLI